MLVVTWLAIVGITRRLFPKVLRTPRDEDE